MYSTTAYLYQQIQRVLLVEIGGGYFTARWNPVYSKQLTINKGVDNVILFEFINQDQKPINITGSDFVFRLLDQSGTRVLLSKELEILSPSIGRAKVVLSDSDTINVVAQPASYSIMQRQPLGDYEQAVYVDANSQARGQANVVDSVMPEFQPSREVTIPTVTGPDVYPQPIVSTGRPDWAQPQTAPEPYTPPRIYSSEVNSPNENFHTFSLDMLNYTGNIVVQAATQYQGPWADVSESYDYYNETDTNYINVAGHYPVLRLAINDYGGVPSSVKATASAVVQNGMVTSIMITNPGQGYIAPPQVVISGVGAGATATATINNGSLTEITVTNGGSGYVQTPPQNQAALVEITTGEITRILYR
jgi:hypothetical protein